MMMIFRPRAQFAGTARAVSSEGGSGTWKNHHRHYHHDKHDHYPQQDHHDQNHDMMMI